MLAQYNRSYITFTMPYYFSITSFILSILVGFCLFRIFSSIGSIRARRFAESTAALLVSILLAVNFFRIHETVRPLREPSESLYSVVQSGQRLLSVQKNWRLCPFGFFGETFPSDARMLFYLLDDFSGQNRTEPVFLDQDRDGTCFLSGYVPWKGQKLSPDDFDMNDGGFSFADGQFSPSGPGRRLLLTRTALSPCDFAVTVNQAGHSGLIIEYGQDRFIVLGVWRNILFGNVFENNKRRLLFIPQLVKPVSPCRFEVRRSGDTLNFFVNGTIWVPILDAPVFKGRIGFFVEDGSAGEKFYDPEVNMVCAEQGFSRILRRRACIGRIDLTTLLSAVRKQAENGSVTTAKYLAAVYFHGRGVARDYAEACRWWKIAAEKGDPEAQNNLAMMYVQGAGVPKDYAEAAKWLNMAAKQGDQAAPLSLGVMYEKGLGVPQDHAEAARWWKIAAGQGD
jgi:hypothetical protein